MWFGNSAWAVLPCPFPTMAACSLFPFPPRIIVQFRLNGPLLKARLTSELAWGAQDKVSLKGTNSSVQGFQVSGSAVGQKGCSDCQCLHYPSPFIFFPFILGGTGQKSCSKTNWVFAEHSALPASAKNRQRQQKINRKEYCITKESTQVSLKRGEVEYCQGTGLICSNFPCM